jgi:heme oxygenase
MTPTADQREATRLSARLRAAGRAHHDDVRATPFVTALHARVLPWKAYADWLSQLFLIHEELVQAESAMVGTAVEPVLVRSATVSLPALAADLRFLYGPRWSDRVTARPATTVYCTHLRDVAFRRFSGFVAHHWTRHAEDLAIARHLAPAVASAYGLDGPGIRFLWPDLTPFHEEYGAIVDATPGGAGLMTQATTAQANYLDVLTDLGRSWA